MSELTWGDACRQFSRNVSCLSFTERSKSIVAHFIEAEEENILVGCVPFHLIQGNFSHLHFNAFRLCRPLSGKTRNVCRCCSFNLQWSTSEVSKLRPEGLIYPVRGDPCRLLPPHCYRRCSARLPTSASEEHRK